MQASIWVPHSNAKWTSQSTTGYCDSLVSTSPPCNWEIDPHHQLKVSDSLSAFRRGDKTLQWIDCGSSF